MPARRNLTRKGPSVSTRATNNSQCYEESEVGELFDHDGEGYALVKQVTRDVAIRRHKDCRSELIVTKVFHRPGRDPGYRPGEIRTIKLLAPCNRIVQLLAWRQNVPERDFSTAIYPYSSYGDLDQWRNSEFVNKSHKPIPESYIWRFLIQMSQALAFMHGQLGYYLPNGIRNVSIVHKDIKPKNILVYYPPSSTYPSFKLHDFGCAAPWNPADADLVERYGTYEWQPPENPLINTPEADVWALGACVHYLCLGRAPIEDWRETQRIMRRVYGGKDPEEVAEYDSAHRYYAAVADRIVTRINLDEEEQEQRLGAPFNIPGLPEYNAVYSDALDKCMRKLLARSADDRPTGKWLVDSVDHWGREVLRKMGGSAALVDLDLVIGGEVLELKD